MKFVLILIIIFFAAGSYLLEAIQEESGYVLISIGGKTFESSFWFALFAIVISCLVLYLFLKIIKNIFLTLSQGQNWFLGWRKLAIERHYREGLLSFLTGDYKQANKQLSTVSKKNELPVVRAIVSAKSLAEQGDLESALMTLKAAEARYPNDIIWLYKARAELLINSGNRFESEKEISALAKIVSKNDETLIALKYLKLKQLGGWLEEIQTLNGGRFIKRLPEQASLFAYKALLKELESKETINKDELDKIWSLIPNVVKKDKAYIELYAELLYRSEQHPRLEAFIRDTLNSQWLPSLLKFWLLLDSKDLKVKLKHTEKWLLKRQDDTDLNFTLGVLSVKTELWEKARAFFEQVNKQGGHKESYFYLAYIAEQLDEKELAFSFYKKASTP